VLSKQHATIVKEMMKHQAAIMLRGQNPGDVFTNYLTYLFHLFKTHDTLDIGEQEEVSYRDYLQSPLQPLYNNLESATYEVFENDTIKYDLY